MYIIPLIAYSAECIMLFAPLWHLFVCLWLAFLLPPSPHTQGAHICKFEHFQVSFHLVSLLYQYCFSSALGLLGSLESSVSTSSFLFIF